VVQGVGVEGLNPVQAGVKKPLGTAEDRFRKNPVGRKAEATNERGELGAERTEGGSKGRSKNGGGG